MPKTIALRPSGLIEILKEHRLQTLSEWDAGNWQEIFDGVKVDWGLVTGQPLSGKSATAQSLKRAMGKERVVVVDLKELDAQIRPTMGTEEGPYEGKIPQAKIEEQVVKMVMRDKREGRRNTYVFDGFPGQSNAAEFAKFAREKLRC